MIRIFSVLVLFFSLNISNGQELKFSEFVDHNFNAPTKLVGTGMDGDDRVFVTQRGGSIRVVTGASTETPEVLVQPFITLTNVSTIFEGGLLGIAFDPNFASNGYFYLSYTSQLADGFSSVISRFTVNDPMDNVANTDTEVTILTLKQPFANHNGGDLAFGPDGMLYIPFGDGGSGGDPFANSQNLTTWLGKMLRIDVSTLPYTIPDDNPFIENEFALDEIWSYGWRNPYRFSFDRMTGDMWVGDVGQDVIEEIDFEAVDNPGGGNYGWDCKEGSQNFEPNNCGSLDGLINPIYEYTHSIGRSITGGYVYRGAKYDDLFGKYVFTDYNNSERWWILNEGKVDIQTFTGNQRLSSVSSLGEDNRGELYAIELISGTIFRIQTNFISTTKNEVIRPIKIFPNPAHDIININGLASGEFSFSVLDVSGKLVLEGLSVSHSIDIKTLASGFYRLKILQQNHISEISFVK